MTRTQLTDRFARLNPGVSIHSSGHAATFGEQNEPLANHAITIPPLTYMIRVRAVITSNATAGGSTVYFRDTPGGDDVAQATSQVLNQPGAWSGFLELNSGRVTFRADIGGATGFALSIWVTGFLRYA